MPGNSNIWSLKTQDGSQVLAFTIPESHPYHQRTAQQIQLDLARHLNSLAQTGQLAEGSPLQTAKLALGKEQTISITTDDRGQLIKHKSLPPSLSWLASITKQDAALHVRLDGLGKTTAEAINCLNQILPEYWGVDPIPEDLQLKQLAKTLFESFLQKQQEYTAIDEEIIRLDEKPYPGKRISIQAVANTIKEMLSTKEIPSLNVLEGLRWDKSDLADRIILKTLGMSEKPAVTKPSIPRRATPSSTARVLELRKRPKTQRPPPPSTAPKTSSPLSRFVVTAGNLAAASPSLGTATAKISGSPSQQINLKELMDITDPYLEQNLPCTVAHHLISNYQGEDFQNTDQGLLAHDATLITVEHIIKAIQQNRVPNVANEKMFGPLVQDDILMQALLIARDTHINQGSATGYGSRWHNSVPAAAATGSDVDAGWAAAQDPYTEVVYEKDDDDDLGSQHTM